jgi:hypothetical protein
MPKLHEILEISSERATEIIKKCESILTDIDINLCDVPKTLLNMGLKEKMEPNEIFYLGAIADRFYILERIN